MTIAASSRVAIQLISTRVRIIRLEAAASEIGAAPDRALAERAVGCIGFRVAGERRVPEDAAAVEHLHRLEVIRERAWMLLAAAERGASDHFVPSPEAVGMVALALAEAIRGEPRADATPTAAGDQPTLANLWQYLRTGEPVALEALGDALAGGDALARAKSGADLALLHRVIEPGGLTGETAALADLVRTFAAGAWTAGSRGMAVLDAPGLRRALAGDGAVGLPASLAELLTDGARRQRLEQLASGLEQSPELFGIDGRFGQIFDRLMAAKPPLEGEAVEPRTVPSPPGTPIAGLKAQMVIDSLAPLIDPIVASTVRIGGQLAGDVWRHPLAWAEDRSRELVPFHCLLLSLTLDLVEPLQEAGRPLADLDQLPIPATRRLAGEILRLGLVRTRHAAVARLRHPPGSDIVVELRALSVALADRLVDRLRAELNRTVHDLPVVRLLGPLSQAAEKWRERPGPGIAITSSSF